MTEAIPFPDSRPQGYEWLPDEPPFEAARHLAIEAPERVWTLEDFGYPEAEIEPTATSVAVSAPFRVLSDEGAEVMLATARALRSQARAAGDRIERMVRSGCYRSKWLRDLCLSPEVTDVMSGVYGVPVAPHTMPVHLGHLNYEPDDPTEAVDKWHHDTLALDYVMLVSDPNKLPGGRFEYFVGTKAEAESLARAGETPPRDRVVQPDFPGPGYAIALHGNMVVHRGGPLDAPAERITMVNGYVALDTSGDDQTRSRDLIVVDDHEVLFTEWSRHAAWRARERLDRLIAELDFGLDGETASAELEAAVADVTAAITDMRAGARDLEHYE